MQSEIEAIEEARKALKKANSTNTSSDCDAALEICAHLYKILRKNDSERKELLDSIFEDLRIFENLPYFNNLFKHFEDGYVPVKPMEVLNLAYMIFRSQLQELPPLTKENIVDFDDVDNNS